MQMTLGGSQTRLTAALLFVLLVSGCGGGGGNAGGGGATLVGPDPTTLSVSATTPGGLTVSLAQDRATVPTGSSVTYTLTLNNTTANPVDIQTVVQASDGLPLVPATLQIVNTAGAVVYPFSPPTPQTTSPVTIQPGQDLTETLSLSNLFRQQDRYRATATFTLPDGATSVGPLVLTAR